MPVSRRCPVARNLGCGAEDRRFESFSGQTGQLALFAHQEKLGKVKAAKGEDWTPPSTRHSQKHVLVLTPIAPTATRLWDTFTYRPASWSAFCLETVFYSLTSQKVIM